MALCSQSLMSNHERGETAAEMKWDYLTWGWRGAKPENSSLSTMDATTWNQEGGYFNCFIFTGKSIFLCYSSPCCLLFLLKTKLPLSISAESDCCIIYSSSFLKGAQGGGHNSSSPHFILPTPQSGRLGWKIETDLASLAEWQFEPTSFSVLV